MQLQQSTVRGTPATGGYELSTLNISASFDAQKDAPTSLIADPA